MDNKNPFINWKKAFDKMKACSHKTKSSSFGTPGNNGSVIQHLQNTTDQQNRKKNSCAHFLAR